MKYNIGKVSKLFRVSSDTLRHYDKIGLLKPNVDLNTGYRFYNMEHIRKLEFILRAKYLEIPLSEIKEILESEDLNQYKFLLSKQQNIIEEKIKHLENIKMLLSKNEEELNKVLNYNENFNFDKLEIICEPKNYYILNMKEYIEDSNITNILGDICDENFSLPDKEYIEDEEFHLYNIKNNEIFEDNENVYLLETKKNKPLLDKYLFNKYGKIPILKIDKYIVDYFYGDKFEFEKYLNILHSHFKCGEKILVKSSFCLYKKINSKHYFKIMYIKK